MINAGVVDRGFVPSILLETAATSLILVATGTKGRFNLGAHPAFGLPDSHAFPDISEGVGVPNSIGTNDLLAQKRLF